MKSSFSDSTVLLCVRLCATAVFLVVVVKCFSEYLGRPFLIDTTIKSGDGNSAVNTKPSFPNVIICSQDQNEADAPQLNTSTLEDIVIDCTVKNYTVSAEQPYISCLRFFRPFFHMEYRRRQCMQLVLPADVKQQASKLHAGYFGVRLMLFLDNAQGQILHSNVTGVNMGLQAAKDDWLSDITWTSTPPGGYSVKVKYQKIYNIKLSKQRSSVCRYRELIEDSNLTHSHKPCEKFVDYEVTTRYHKFPTAQFGPVLLSRAFLTTKRSGRDRLNTRLKELIQSEPISKLYQKFLHIHLLPDVDADPEILEEKIWYTQNMLLSNIGGCLGMFLGASMLDILISLNNKLFHYSILLIAKIKDVDVEDVR